MRLAVLFFRVAGRGLGLVLAMGVAGIEPAMETLVQKHPRALAKARANDSPAALSTALDALVAAVERALAALPVELATPAPTAPPPRQG